MEDKKTKKKVSKSMKKRLAATKKSKKNNTVTPKDVKYRVTFLKGQLFRGVWHEEGSSITLPENDAKAYSKRSNLKIERI
jgi:hypothetical protein